MMAGGQTAQHLRAEDLVGRIDLSVFHRPAVGGGKEQDIVLPHDLREVMVKISRLIGILEDEQEIGMAPCGQSGKQQGCRGSQKALKGDDTGALLQQPRQGAALGDISIKSL